MQHLQYAHVSELPVQWLPVKSVKSLALGAILTALCVGILYLAGILPAGQLGFVAVAALLPAVALIHSGIFWGIGVYVASSALALLLLPDKLAALWFVLVLGHYGVMKSLIERIGKLVPEWILKLAVFGLTTAAMYLLFRGSFIAALPSYSLWIVWGALLVCFVLYDIAFSALIALYCKRIKPHVQK